MRATHASIGHRLKLDPKVTADQRGHGVGVAIEEYTKTSLKDRAVAAKKLEEAVLGKPKVVRMSPAEGFLMECNGMQVFSVSLSPLFGAGDGTRTRDVQLGKLAFYH